MKTFSNSGYKIIYLKPLPYEFNQSHSKNAEQTISNCITNPNVLDSKVPCRTTGDYHMVGHPQRGHHAPSCYTYMYYFHIYFHVLFSVMLLEV